MSKTPPTPPVPPNVPGLQYPTHFPPDTPALIQGIFRNIYDNLFYIRRASVTPQPLTPTQIRQIEQQIISQIITSITNNVTNNITNLGGLFLIGTHNLRITVYGGATKPTGTGFFEVDRNVIYIITDTSGGPPKRWEFAAGCMIETLANRPTDLATYDASFLFFASDTSELYIWDGSAWQLISGGSTSTGYWSPLAAGTPDAPEIVFDYPDGNVVVVFTATP